MDKLIRSNLARRLRSVCFGQITKKKIEKLEREMSARWGSLDPHLILFSDMDPQARNAYVGLWETHRSIYGYTLLAELPFRAGNAIEDFGLEIEDIDLLVVDEYQDLNNADIRLVHLLEDLGASVLAIGDDDQSIYSFRMAAPQGILRFPDEFNGCVDYQLTLSRRCGREILEAATSMIETVPYRGRKPRLRYGEDATKGRFLYLRFSNEREEARGVADLILSRQQMGVPLGEIAVLVRSQVNTWANLLMPELRARAIDAVEPGRAASIFKTPHIRSKLAILRLAIDPTDSLSWWALLKLENGISQQFRDYIYDEARRANASYGSTLMMLAPQFAKAPTRRSSSATTALIDRVSERIAGFNFDEIELGDEGWADWVIDFIGRDHLEDDAIALFKKVGMAVPAESGLGYFIGHLEPLVRDFAAQSDSVRIMSMTSSKGITINTCIVMGVERGIIPHPRAQIEEERRLLYVAMTRATDMCVLTFAGRRRGPTARHGAANVNRPRGRSPLLEALPIGQHQDGRLVVDALLAANARP
jgi:DNA helicase-2/ATP-dependent DNA helicase PcrA